MDSYFSLVNVVAAAISFLALLGTIFFMLLNRKSRSHQENKTTASSLSLPSPPTSLPSHNRKHHVFPSFHGPDVRKAFLSHILKDFKSKGIDTFIDNDMERSKTIGHELIEAIRGSRIAIVLLSENYASSTWCLNELVEIMECREKLDQTVIPIFYEVDPTDIRKQTRDFGKVFKKTCKGKAKEDIRRWKHALTEVAQITGHHSTNWKNDTKMIEDIATDVSNKLNNSAPSSDFDSLVGMKSQMTKMGPLLQLDSDEVRTIGILGQSGIGKTTIARYIFNQHSRDFQISVFMESLKTRYAIPACSDDYSVKLDLQNQFMSQLTNEVGIKIPHLGVAKDRLKEKKVLVVLDDVNRLVQLEAMVKETWYGPGSRIIITTQDQKILTAGGIEHIYKVDLPSDDEALEMFCMYAFGQKSPKDGFMELASEVTRLVGELPLGLRVMGSHFRGMCKEDWRMALPSLKTRLDRDGEIESILKFSYDALCDEDKRLFLHIACFFKDELVDTVEDCLASCFLDVKQGLCVLVEKSLIYVDYGRIEMQKLLAQLGRKIVREQSSDPGKRQFVDDEIDIGDVHNDDKAGSTSNVLGINFKKDITYTSERAFERLSNLQFLRIRSDGINPRSLNSISGKLKFLSWWKFGMPCFPSSFNPKFLINLDMQQSKLRKLWKKTQPFSNLKRMDLSYSRSLEELPDLSSATNLGYLNLEHCLSLVELPFSIGNAVNLENLNISHCSSLVRLPSSIGNAVNLWKLNLSYCSSLVELPSSIGNAINLLKLDLSYCSSLVKLPTSIGNAINLQFLDLRCCPSLVELPSSIRNLRRLSRLELEKCSKLEVLLANINLEFIEELNLSGCSLLKIYRESSTNIQDLKPSGTTVTEATSSQLTFKSEMCEIKELGPWIGRISFLRRLVLSRMKNLVSLPQLPYSVVELDAENCESLERLDCSFLNPGIRLNFRNSFNLNQEARDLIIQTPTNKYAVLPGGEVPQCFTYRSSGSSLTVKLNQSTSTKFKACLVCADEVERGVEDYDLYRVSCSITSKDNVLTCYKKINGFYPGNLYTFEVEAEEVTSTELVFEFMISSPDLYEEWKIKECGINYSFPPLVVSVIEPPSRENPCRGEVREVKMDKGAMMIKRPKRRVLSSMRRLKNAGFSKFWRSLHADEHYERFRDGDEDYEVSH